MKVLVVSTTSRMASGATHSMICLVRGLMEAGVEVEVVLKTPGEVEEELEKLRVPFHIFKEWNDWCCCQNKKLNLAKEVGKKAINMMAYQRFLRHISEGGFDVVHVNSLTAHIAAEAALALKVPLVWHMREMMEDGLGFRFINPKKAYGLISKSTRAIAVSDAVKAYYAPRVSCPIDVVYNGIPSHFFQSRSRVKNKPITILNYGRITPLKGLLTYVEAIEGLSHAISTPFQALIAGYVDDEKYFELCHQYIIDKGLSDRVSYIGELRDVASVLRDVDIVCVCSKQEAFGRAIAESMASGCLVVASSAGGIPELIDDGVTGYLYGEWDDSRSLALKLTEAINSIDRSCAIARAGQEHAYACFSEKKYASEIMLVYENAINSCQ